MPQSDFQKAHQYEKGFFHITSLHRDDLKNMYDGKPNYEEKCKEIDALTDEDMEYISSVLADDYCEQLFWDSLQVIYEEIFPTKDK